MKPTGESCAWHCINNKSLPNEVVVEAFIMLEDFDNKN